MDTRLVDLHTHTTFSDGALEPEALLEEAHWKGLSALAVTDHDHIGAIPLAMEAGRKEGVEVVAGVELSCESGGQEVHILGLLIDPTEALEQQLTAMRENRRIRMAEMLDRLREMGINLTMEDLPQVEGNSFGRPHLAQLLLQKGYVRSIAEAFARYIGDDKPGYVAKLRWSVEEGIALIHEAGGLACLAHPGAGGTLDGIPAYAALGLDGIEVYYPKHSPQMEKTLLAACQAHGLVFCGGSDYHAHESGVELGVPRVPYAVLEGLRERVRGRKG